MSRPGRHELQVLLAHARMAMATELQYRSNAWVYLVNTSLTLFTSLASVALVYRHVDAINGWSSADLYVVVGVFFALGAVVNGIVHLSMSKLVSDIRTGDFDYRLLRPVDAQVVALGQAPDPWRVFDVLAGIGLVTYGIGHGDGFAQVTGGALGAALAAVGMFACGIAITAGFWALLACITFWTIQGEGILWALDDMYDHLRWPISIFPGGLRIALSTIFPAGLAVTVPAQALTGRLDPSGALAAIGVAVAFSCAARIVWHRAVRRYDGASA